MEISIGYYDNLTLWVHHAPGPLTIVDVPLDGRIVCQEIRIGNITIGVFQADTVEDKGEGAIVEPGPTSSEIQP